MIAILGIVLIIIALFVVPLVIYPIVAVAIVVAMRFLMSQSAGQQVRKGTAPWKAEQSRSSIPPVPWMLNTCPNCGAAMSELGTRFYCAKDDILIHKATGFMIDGVPRTEWQRLIDARVSIRGERGEYLISLSNEALIITDGDVNTLQLVTEKEHLMLRTIDPKLWKENVERRMEQSRRVAAVPPEASEAKIHKSKFCINCGAPLQANATFCVECGSKQ
jgi:ribosomal protein L40E